MDCNTSILIGLQFECRRSADHRSRMFALHCHCLVGSVAAVAVEFARGTAAGAAAACLYGDSPILHGGGGGVRSDCITHPCM